VDGRRRGVTRHFGAARRRAGARPLPEGPAATAAPDAALRRRTRDGTEPPRSKDRRVWHPQRTRHLGAPPAAGRPLVAPGAQAKPNIFKVARQWEGGSAAGAVNSNDWRTDAVWSVPSISVLRAGEAGQSETSSAGTAIRSGSGCVLRHAEATGDQSSRSRDWPGGTTRPTSAPALAAQRGDRWIARGCGSSTVAAPEPRFGGGSRTAVAVSRPAEERRLTPPWTLRRPRTGEGTRSSRRQRDRRPLAELTDFGPAALPQGSSGSPTTGGVGSDRHDSMLRHRAPAGRERPRCPMDRRQRLARRTGFGPCGAQPWSSRLARSAGKPGQAPSWCFGTGKQPVRRALSLQGTAAGNRTANRPRAWTATGKRRTGR
jgi:hypothetical protein